VLAKGLLAEPFKWTNNSKTLLLNGMANNNHASESCLTDLPVITVGYDMQYRLRWIGAGSLMYIAAGIEDHETTFLEADGTNLKPGKMVDHIEFAPGQRYSMRLQTKTREQVKADGKDGVYLINLSSRWRRPIVQQFAVLKYVDKPSTDPFPRTKFYDTAQNPRLREAMKTYVLPDESFGWLQTDLEPLVDRPIPENVKKNVIVLDMQQIRYGLGGFRWAMNKEIYDEEKGLRQEPYLVSLYKGALPMPQAHNNSLWDPTSEAFVLEPGQVVDIIFVNRPGPTSKVEVHPIHLHSRAVHVLAQGAGSPDIRKLLKTTYTKAYRRDTVNVYPGPGATITNSTATYDQAGGWVHTRYLASARDTGAWVRFRAIL
jgi:FtsP/CotA-like multicopper oxidase with cupredoxin domain